MSQVYERVYSRLAGNQLNIVADGNAYLLRVPFPPAGFLTKTLVQQSAGSNVAFTVDILNSNLGLTPGEINPATLPAGWQQYRVVNPLAGLAGAQAQGFTPAGNPFRNVDGPDPVRAGVSAAGLGPGGAAGGGPNFTNAQRYLYVLVKPSAGGGANNQWEVAVGSFSEIG